MGRWMVFVWIGFIAAAAVWWRRRQRQAGTFSVRPATANEERMRSLSARLEQLGGMRATQPLAPAIPSEQRCEACGTVSAGTNDVCTFCGTLLHTATPPPPVEVAPAKEPRLH